VAFTILSALAEGADRFIASQALTVLGDTDVQLEAVLPLTVEDYHQDFHTERSRREFEKLLDEAGARRIELAHLSTRSERERQLAYRRAGYYIVNRSDVLIAVWDRKEAHGIGGTSDVVDYATRQGVPVLIVATGVGDEESRLASRNLPPDNAPHFEASQEAFRRIDKFNQTTVGNRRLQRVLCSAESKLESRLGDSLIRGQFRSVEQWAMPRFARAELLALRCQCQFRDLGRAIHFLAAFAVAVVAWQTVFRPAEPGWLGVEIALLVLLIVGLEVGRWKRFHDRWIGYRSLAENFRSGLFITLCGLHDRQDSDDLADIGAFDEPWFQRAFSEAWRYRPTVKVEAADAPELRRLLIEAWIDDQIDYHQDRSKYWRRQRNRYRWGIGALVLATIVVAAIHIANSAGEEWNKWFAFLAITLPGFGAALTGLREHGQYRVHEERSTRTVSRLERLKVQLEQVTRPTSMRRLAAETQRVMAEENLDWSGALEFQDLEMVV